MNKQITSVEELKRLASINEFGGDFFIGLNFGLRSSYNIRWVNGKFIILQGMTGECIRCSETELETETNILTAIKKGAFYID